MAKIENLPNEMIYKILEKVPQADLLKMSHVNRSFNQLSLSLITNSESYFWRKNTREDPDGSRSLLLKFNNLQILNMDYCQPMFDSMSNEEIEHFSSLLAIKCKKISTIYFSDIISFRIVHQYVNNLAKFNIKNRLKKLIIFIDSDVDESEKELILQQIIKLSPQIQFMDVTRCQTNINTNVTSRRLSNCSIDSNISSESENTLCISCQSLIEDKPDDLRREIENEAFLHSQMAGDETHCI